MDNKLGRQTGELDCAHHFYTEEKSYEEMRLYSHRYELKLFSGRASHQPAIQYRDLRLTTSELEDTL